MDTHKYKHISLYACFIAPCQIPLLLHILCVKWLLILSITILGWEHHTYLGQYRPVDVETEQPGSDQPPLFHINGVHVQEAASSPPRLQLQLKLLKRRGRQKEHTCWVHLQEGRGLEFGGVVKVGQETIW